MNSRDTVVRALSKILDANEVYEILDAVEEGMLSTMLSVIVERYSDRGGRKILRKLVEALETEDPSLARRLEAVAKKRPATNNYMRGPGGRG